MSPGSRVRWVSLGSWSCGLPAPQSGSRGGERGGRISELCLSLPSILYLVYLIGWNQLEARSQGSSRDAFHRGQLQGTGQSGQGWRVALERQTENGAYAPCFMLVCVFSLCPKGSLDPDPLSLPPCSCEKLNPQPSILMPSLSIQRAAHAYLSYSIKHLAKQLSIYLSVSLTTVGAHPC